MITAKAHAAGFSYHPSILLVCPRPLREEAPGLHTLSLWPKMSLLPKAAVMPAKASLCFSEDCRASPSKDPHCWNISVYAFSCKETSPLGETSSRGCLLSSTRLRTRDGSLDKCSL